MKEFSSRFLEKETLNNIRMTALVSVMNKHAVVIAADSAITVTTPYGHKVINSANKVLLYQSITLLESCFVVMLIL